jgi:hypothetical protein
VIGNAADGDEVTAAAALAELRHQQAGEQKRTGEVGRDRLREFGGARVFDRFDEEHAGVADNDIRDAAFGGHAPRPAHRSRIGDVALQVGPPSPPLPSLRLRASHDVRSSSRSSSATASRCRARRR